MPRQLEFWPTAQSPPPIASVWKDLDMEERTALVAALVRMIAKAVHPQPVHENEEMEDER